jgi:hypothetical protein
MGESIDIESMILWLKQIVGLHVPGNPGLSNGPRPNLVLIERTTNS